MQPDNNRSLSSSFFDVATMSIRTVVDVQPMQLKLLWLMLNIRLDSMFATWPKARPTTSPDSADARLPPCNMNTEHAENQWKEQRQTTCASTDKTIIRRQAKPASVHQRWLRLPLQGTILELSHEVLWMPPWTIVHLPHTIQNAKLKFSSTEFCRAHPVL